MKSWRESTTLKFVWPAAVILLIKFFFAGLTISGLSFPPMSAQDFGIAFAAIMAIWLGREWRKDHYKDKGDV